MDTGSETAPPDALDALEGVERSIEAAWEDERRQHPEEDAGVTARRIVADPTLHPWRLVDAALTHLDCPDCGTPLGSGRRGCEACDLADGYRFAAHEPDRPGAPPGNEHAIRVSSAVLRAPHRYPAWTVEGNKLLLPLFVAGEMPARRDQEILLDAARRGVPVTAVGVRTFRELAARAETALRDRA